MSILSFARTVENHSLPETTRSGNTVVKIVIGKRGFTAGDPVVGSLEIRIKTPRYLHGGEEFLCVVYFSAGI